MITKLSKKQKSIMRFAVSKDNYLICEGAVRSGKTIIMVMAFVIWAMASFEECNFGICAKTVNSAERNILKPLQKLHCLPYKLTYKITDRMLTVQCGNRKNYFYFFGGKDESSYSLIQGITLAGVLLDEVALMPRSFVEQAMARTLSYENAKIWFNCNPETPQHWFYNEWIKKPRDKLKHLHFLMEDNPIMSKESIAKTKSMYQGVFYERYILGLWVAAEGAVYQIFSENKTRFLTSSPDYDFINIGVDFGGNGSYHTFVATGLKYNCSTLTALMSERHKATGTSPEDLNKLFKAFVDRVVVKYGNITAVYADSAEQILINGLKAKFPNLTIRNSIKNEIIDRIRTTTSLMAQGRFFITSDCETLADAFEGAVYDSKQIDDIRLDNGTSDIDTLDAFEYSFEKVMTRYIKAVEK